MKKFIGLKKIVVIIFLSKNLDNIFFDCILNALKPIYSKNINKIIKQFDNSDMYELSNCFVYILLVIYLNILSTDILHKNYNHMLYALNQETSIFDINRRKFFPSSSELLKKKFEFQMQKDFYYKMQQRKRFSHMETILSLERFNNIKYL